ncbi:MAG: GntR family transcriptional regulator [Actinomycetota bacterium]|nr:GntR family transcriptional regulator [Actinomycetota bacterium]
MDAAGTGEAGNNRPPVLLNADELPLYDRVASLLLNDLEAEGARPGDRLPSERQLTERYRVSRVTLRSALRQLHERGVVDSSPSRGWFVTDVKQQRDARAAQPEQVPSFTDLAEAQGLRSETKVLSTDVRPCTLHEAGTLRMAPGAQLFELHRIRYLEKLAIAVEHNRLPLSICPELASVDFERDSLYATLRRAVPPQVPCLADYSVEARQATAEEKQLLDITEPVPLLVATQLSFNASGRPIELTTASYRGDRYQFRASITSDRRI